MRTQDFVLKTNNILKEILADWRKDCNKYYKNNLNIIFDFVNVDCGLIGVTIDLKKGAKREDIETILKKYNINFYKREGFGGLFSTIEFAISEEVDINIYQSLFNDLNNIS
ncbi:hypothetical protein [Campylobacter sp. RM12651]|uniref:hypothetical protein n=1 Tax=Campylobacter sp. RM12651 TaxID=1660079 RepID=UPI001EFA59FD|nr:hypothetical protein [Campylobacter sp. RM12651]ULO04549.1 hypothetical protein AVBRAN_a0067 [Campylobacter sp. RM12651]